MKDNKLSFEKMRNAFFFGTIIILGLVILYIIRPFLYPLFWAAVITMMFYPIYQFLLHHLKKESISSIATIALAFITIFLPLSILSLLLVNESVSLYTKVSQSGVFQNPEKVSSWLEKLSFLSPYFEYIRTEWTSYIGQLAKWLSTFLVSSITEITTNSLRFLCMMLIMFYALYYFLKDGVKILKRLMYLSPLGDKYETMLLDKFKSTTRATLKSTLIIGIMQGTIGGILFLITGVKGAFVWGVIMAFIAIIPALGPAIVLAPTALIMFTMGNFWQALVLLIGSILVSIVDNLVRPPLIGKDTQMHPLIVFFATVGGLIMFGISGFIIGPVIAALFISVLSIYDHYYKNELSNN